MESVEWCEGFRGGGWWWEMRQGENWTLAVWS